MHNHPTTSVVRQSENSDTKVKQQQPNLKQASFYPAS
jgi:hypothetical protein